jgi:lipoate-protein ligase A
MKVDRLIVDPPQPGDWNMAVDEALLRSAAQGITTLRFYEWSEPTLSLGYFQACRDRQSHVASRDCAVVRRASGGGAILHDRELTYSFSAPIADRLSASVDSLYLAFHETLVDALAGWGVSARLCRHPPLVGSSAAPQPFLCFERRTRGDVLLDHAKVCGSAQRRHGGAVLQHGSVILRTSKKAPEIAGIEQLRGPAIACRELAKTWSAKLESRLCASWQPGDLTPKEHRAAWEIQGAKFATQAWLDRR